MTSKHRKKWLSDQQYQINLQRRVLIDHLYQMLEELEGRSIPRRGYGFPFSVMASGINKGLDAFESLVDKGVLKALKKLKNHDRGRKR
jgi:hypothetical protein